MGTVLMGTEGVEVHGSGSECSFDTLETGGGSKEDNETRDGSKDESKDDTSCTSEEWRAQVTWLDIDKARRGIRSAQGSRSVAVWSSTGPSRMRSSPVKFEHPLPDLKQLTSQHGLSLHSALNNQGQLKELLKRRATNDPNVHDSDGDRTPLHWCAARGHTRCAELLLAQHVLTRGRATSARFPSPQGPPLPPDL
eukprot:Transcript_6168.p1 GENE.Transcript_6168~~Transcript_6168.p1  ORF type:complete len:195 (+),score=31.76 Transcript_6168:44-628(+)